MEIMNNGQLRAELTIDVTLDRVLVLPCEMNDDQAEIAKGLIIGDNLRQQLSEEKMLKEMGLMKAEVVAVGPGIYARETGAFIPTVTQVGDIVYVYHNQFEAAMNINEQKHLLYPERCILAKDKPTVNL